MQEKMLKQLSTQDFSIDSFGRVVIENEQLLSAVDGASSQFLLCQDLAGVSGGNCGCPGNCHCTGKCGDY
jgi:hypothetical protein